MKYFFWIILLVLTVSCSRDNSPPEGILGEEKMVSFLKEAYYAETKVKNLHLSNDSSRLLFRHYELALYQKYDITEEEFTRSYNYYLQNPLMLEDINAAILDSLGVMESLLEKEGRGGNRTEAGDVEDGEPIPPKNRREQPAQDPEEGDTSAEN
ncbi:MAG: DUF4296 domain-containing protein [Cyclobacteriaceae bacterium]